MEITLNRDKANVFLQQCTLCYTLDIIPIWDGLVEMMIAAHTSTTQIHYSTDKNMALLCLIWGDEKRELQIYLLYSCLTGAVTTTTLISHTLFLRGVKMLNALSGSENSPLRLAEPFQLAEWPWQPHKPHQEKHAQTICIGIRVNTAPLSPYTSPVSPTLLILMLDFLIHIRNIASHFGLPFVFEHKKNHDV